MTARLTDHRLRPFEHDDQDRVREMVLNGLGDHFGLIDATLNPDLDDLVSYYTAAGHYLVVAETDSKVIAAGALIALGDCAGRIARVTVDREYRQQGVGRAIVSHLITIGVNRGYRQLVVETNHDWTAAIALYLSCGFSEYDRDDESVYMCLTLPFECQTH